MEPFKNVFHPQAIRTLSAVMARHAPRWNEESFFQRACRDLDSLELKQRSEQIYRTLCEELPSDFPAAAAILRASLHPNCDGNASGQGASLDGIQGWLIMPMAEYVGRKGSGHLELALELLKEMTMRFTSEFGIRHLWLSHPEKVMSIVQHWTNHENEHVRRLVSEGSRPRLPWGMQLPDLIKHPQRTWKLLESLRDDPSAYVRKSVANHLNDNARDHPNLVLDLAHQWHADAPPERQRLLRHALRNLLKQGHSRALALYQLTPPRLIAVDLHLPSAKVARGDDLHFSLEIKSAACEPQRIRLDIVMHYLKANGRLTQKVFRWKDITLAAGDSHRAERKQSFREITTRVYHPGAHRLEIKANGEVVAGQDFELS